MYMNEFCPGIHSFLEAVGKSHWVKTLRSLMEDGRKKPIAFPRASWWNKPWAKGESHGEDRIIQNTLNNPKAFYSLAKWRTK